MGHFGAIFQVSCGGLLKRWLFGRDSQGWFLLSERLFCLYPVCFLIVCLLTLSISRCLIFIKHCYHSFTIFIKEIQYKRLMCNYLQLSPAEDIKRTLAPYRSISQDVPDFIGKKTRHPINHFLSFFSSKSHWTF